MNIFDTDTYVMADEQGTSDTGSRPRMLVLKKDDNVPGPEMPSELPVLPLRGMVVFPGTVLPLNIRRPSSLKLLEECLPKSKMIAVVAQRQPDMEDPTPDDLFEAGTAGQVLKLIRQDDDVVVVVFQAMKRVKFKKFTQVQPYMKAKVDTMAAQNSRSETKQWEATVKNLREAALKLLSLTPDTPEEAGLVVRNIEDAGQLADFLASNLSLDYNQKQDLLEETDVVRRVRAVHLRLSAQIEIAELQRKLQKDVASQISDAQRRVYLREQIKAIQKELGEADEGEEQVQQLRKRLEEARPPKVVLDQAEKELRRLAYIPQASPEYSVVVGYVETLAELPWSKLSPDNLDLRKARAILDRDHHGLDKVKRRLVEYLAVRKLNPEGRGPILCFLGPPGVGKTSLGQSIADALGRKFARMSLGGMHDEAEIRGHRRTYIGSMPGRIVQALRQAGTRNPVIMLDEIDKIGSDFRGDPASALLEVLDPRQNHAFVDHYLNVPFDLSQVIFIATANYMDPVPPALRDRMEVISIPGYTDREKLQIALKYLVKRQLKENGLKLAQCRWNQQAVTTLIHDYTYEAGVRELEREIGAVCRAVAARVAGGRGQNRSVTPVLVREILGPKKHIQETRLRKDQIGVVTGLAYTPAGGEILHIEAARYAGKGAISLTGQIGNVMKESAQAALSLVRSRARELGINPDDFKDADIHIHVPSGAVPKDGPSAGVAMVTVLASLFGQRPVRADVAMTGEITLRGEVLPIGGLKEKSLAALRAGITEVIIPALNEKDLVDVPKEIRHKLKFHLAHRVDDVLKLALVPINVPRQTEQVSKS